MLQKSPIYAYIPARDVSRARRFYEDKLGLRPKQEVAGGVIYEFGKGKKRGVKFEEYDLPDMKTKNGIFTGGGAKAAWFKDTEGNTLAVIQDDS